MNFPHSFSAVAMLCGVAIIASGAGDEGRMPNLNGAVSSSFPLRRAASHCSERCAGQLLDVSFIDSLRELPYMKAWATRYKDAGLVVIGVHAPEFGFETDPANVKNAASDLKVSYPIPIDSNDSIGEPSATNTGPRTTSSTQRGEPLSPLR